MACLTFGRKFHQGRSASRQRIFKASGKWYRRLGFEPLEVRALLSVGYYVNDGSVNGLGDWTQSPGSSANDGLSPQTPLDSIRAVVETYDLGYGDVIYVDDGTYDLDTNIIIGRFDSGVTIRGYNDPAYPERGAVLDRGDTVSENSYAVVLFDADDVTLDYLAITGAYHGVIAPENAGSDRLTISNSEFYGNSHRGIYLRASNDDANLTRNTFHDQMYGVYLRGTDRARVTDSEFYGNTFGIFVDGYSVEPNDRIEVLRNDVYDNTDTGIVVQASGPNAGVILVSQNRVWGHDGPGDYGIDSFSGPTISNNEVFDNDTGIHGYWGMTISGNRVYNNTGAGIVGDHGPTIAGNFVYSNSTGIVGTDWGKMIRNNVVYANSEVGIRIGGQTNSSYNLFNNTVYQPTGNAVVVEVVPQPSSPASTFRGADLHNNILWVEDGYAVTVAPSSFLRFDSDYNLFYTGANAQVGLWGDQASDTLADWRSTLLGDSEAVGDKEQHSKEGDPGFADVDGVDNVLGYTAASGGYDGGQDDNFYLTPFSPAIDWAEHWGASFPETDVLGLERFDDLATPNFGLIWLSLGYSSFAATGTAKGFNGDGTAWNLPFPAGFSFPFYGDTYTDVAVSSEGFLLFAGSLSPGDGDNTLEKLYANRMIAPLWDNLRTDGPGDDVFVDTSISDRVTIRWDATNDADGSDVNVSATLFDDGRVRFDYGAGNSGLSPTIGVSRGDERFYQLPLYNGLAYLRNYPSLQSRATYADLGAYEFHTQSNDTVPPRVEGTVPAIIEAGGTTVIPFSEIEVNFNESLSPIYANAAYNYELRGAVTGGFEDGDDVVYSLTPSYNLNELAGTSVARLAIDLGPGVTELPADTYRLTVNGAASSGIRDGAGWRLDGNRDGLEGSDYVRTFSVVNNLSVGVGNVTVVEGDADTTTATFTVSLSGIGPSSVTVDFETVEVPGGATAGVDFEYASGQLAFLPGAPLVQTVDVIIYGDTDPESTETFHLTPSNVQNAVVGDAVGVGMIVDDDSPGSIAGYHVFYNGSEFDGKDPAANALDDNAIALDKTVLLPGETAGPANFTNFAGGITGIMVDVAGLPDPQAITAADFRFRVGNVDDVSSWSDAPEPVVTIREGVGHANSHRISLAWTEGAIVGQWVEVTLLATDRTTLIDGDAVFYFGNAVGDTGNSATDALVNAADVIAIRDNPRGPQNPASIGDPHDLNRDGRVDATDLILARNNATSPLSALRLITPLGASPAPLLAANAEGPRFQPAGEGESLFATGSLAGTGMAFLESLDGLMATQADQPAVESPSPMPMPSPMLGKLLRRLGSAINN